MSYSDREFGLVAAAVNGTMTATASAHVVTQTAAHRLPKYPVTRAINRISVKVVTAPNAGHTGTLLIFNNAGTAFGTVTIGTNTAGQEVTIEAPTRVAGNAALTVSIKGTATASQNTDSGTYDVWFETE